MSRKTDLECHIRETDTFIHEYRQKILCSDETQERARDHKKIEYLRGRLRDWLEEYTLLCAGLYISMPHDIYELAINIGIAVPPITSPAHDSPVHMETSDDPVIIVARFGKADYHTIGEAVRSAAPGTRILVRPGCYSEGVVLDRTVEIVGDGPLDKIVIDGVDTPALLMQTDYAVVCGLTLRGTSTQSDGAYHTVDIPQGRLVMESCDVTCDQANACASCIHVHGAEAAPTITGCTIHHSKGSGVLFSQNSGGRMERCDIYANACPGVMIQTGSNPTIWYSKIHDGKNSGVVVTDHGGGVLEACAISKNAFVGVVINGGSNPTLRHNTMSDNGYVAVWLFSGGRGVIDECDLSNNRHGAWSIEAGCKVQQRGNRE